MYVHRLIADDVRRVPTGRTASTKSDWSDSRVLMKVPIPDWNEAALRRPGPLGAPSRAAARLV